MIIEDLERPKWAGFGANLLTANTWTALVLSLSINTLLSFLSPVIIIIVFNIICDFGLFVILNCAKVRLGVNTGGVSTPTR